MTSTQLSQRLDQLGVAPRQARNSALLDLAEHLAAPVIADTLGITIATAEHWRALAGAPLAQLHRPTPTSAHPDQPPPGTAFDQSK